MAVIFRSEIECDRIYGVTNSITLAGGVDGRGAISHAQVPSAAGFSASGTMGKRYLTVER